MARSDIGRQIQLPWAVSVRMAYQGIRVELRRSILSGLSIVCTLAFLTFVWTDEALLKSLRIAAQDDVDLRGSLLLTGRLDPPESARQRTQLLVVLSLILCTVGISNAMAMSVTERFQQIGTMKCLGSLDSFIVRIFFLEAMFLGLAGTIAGNVVGVILALLQETFAYGAAALINLPLFPVFENIGWSLLVGVGISLIGALYPARVASKMQPVEAMRVTT